MAGEITERKETPEERERNKREDQSNASLEPVARWDPIRGEYVSLTRADWKRLRGE